MRQRTLCLLLLAALGQWRLVADIYDIDHQATGSSDPACVSIHNVAPSVFTSCGGNLDFFGTPYQATMVMKSDATLNSIKSLVELQDVSLPDGLVLAAVNDKEVIRATSSTFVSTNLTVTGGTGDGILRLTYTIDGGHEFTGSQDFAAAATFIVSSGFNRLGLFSYSYRDGITVNSPTGSLTADLPFTFGVPVALEQDLDLFVSGFFLGQNGPVSSARATVDYSRTISLGPLGVFDPGMAPLSGVTVASDSGFLYPLAQGPQAIPEPSSLILLLSAAAIAAARGIGRSTRLT